MDWKVLAIIVGAFAAALYSWKRELSKKRKIRNEADEKRADATDRYIDRRTDTRTKREQVLSRLKELSERKRGRRG